MYIDVTNSDRKKINEINLRNGSAEGSLRSINSKTEDDTYTIGINAIAEGMDAKASGDASHAEGISTFASGASSHAEGAGTVASGASSHAEGSGTIAEGMNSHAEGEETIASSEYQHVQGKYNIEDSIDTYADIIGNGTSSKRSNAATVDWSGNAWYAGNVYVGSTSGTNKDSGSKKLATEEYVNTAVSSVSPGSGGLQRVALFYDGTNIRLADESQAIQTYQDILSLASSDVATDVMLLRGQYIIYRPLGLDSKNNIIFGRSYKDTDGRTVVSTIGISSENVVFCEDTYNVGVTTSDFGEIFGVYSGENVNSATAYGAHAEGGQTRASGSTSHAEGWATQASGDNSHAEGELTIASALDSHAEGKSTTASGDRSHAEGLSTTASGYSSHSEGEHSVASGLVSHAEGYETSAVGDNSHSEGLSTKANGPQSHAEGASTVASGQTSHAEGDHTASRGNYSHSEGQGTLAFGYDSHSEGFYTVASGSHSHAEGNATRAEGESSHSEGIDTKATSSAQHVQGVCNIEDSEGVYLDIIGNGVDTDHRSNAATVDKQGNAWYAGNVYVGSTSGTNRDEGSKKLATEEYVNSVVISGGSAIVIDDGSID